ncbi:GNAT family N-acetyltransferase [Actinoplanes sp. RD1]|uniref:GNAT family N-acetyltransferase n=1 Tax=Actinoplanes sp. RD1 TaxID=3064538 RepID=UPI0027408342|nr:GNAT family N-acetyltransferase [Actinoplanes sp. RD1]
MTELIAPVTSLHAAFLDCHDEWGPGLHEDGFGLHAGDDVRSPEGFARWVRRVTRLAHPAGTPCPSATIQHSTARWIVEDGRVLGGITLRHLLDVETGHIGYGLRASARRRGIGTWALGQILKEAPATMSSVLCVAENTASARTIERNGGVPEPGSGPARRYWITLQAG